MALECALKLKAILDIHAKGRAACIVREFVEKAVVAKIDQDHLASGGEAVLLKGGDQKVRMTLESCMSDDRRRSSIAHLIEGLSRIEKTSVSPAYPRPPQPTFVTRSRQLFRSEEDGPSKLV